MPTVAIIIIVIIFVSSIIIGFVLSWKRNIKKNQKIAEEIEQKGEEIKLGAMLEANQHLKYKKKITLQILITGLGYILLSASIILLIVLPVFQIKYKLLDLTVGTKNFSLIDTYADIKNAKNEGFYTDIKFNYIATPIILIVAAAILILLQLFDIIPFDRKNDIVNTFVDSKINKKKYLDRASLIWFIVLSGAFIFEIINLITAEFKYTSNIKYTSQSIDNIIYYYNPDGSLAFKVFQNDFKFCNGVSGYIAIPIILFTVGFVLYFMGQHLKRSLINEISKETADKSQDTANSESGNE